MKKSTKVLLTSLLAVGMAGCSSSSASTSSTSGSSSSAAPDRSLTLATSTAVTTLDSSLAADSASVSIISNTQEGLYTLDGSNTPVPALAESYDVSDDGLTYTFHLRDDAKWSNGDPVTANDFVYAWRRLMDPATASENAWFMESMCVKNADEVNTGEVPVDQLGVAAPDDTTFVVTLSKPCPYFVAASCFPAFYPLNEKFVESEGSNYALTKDDLLSNSAYYVSDWDVGGDTITMSKNDSYYDADDVTFESITYRVVSDEQEAVMSYENGDLDYVEMSGTLAENYKNSPDFETILQGGASILMTNFQNGPTQNQDFRLAIGYAIDRDTLVNSVLNDGSKVLTGVVPSHLAANEDGTDYREFAGDLMNTDKDKAKEYWESAKKDLGDKVTVNLLYDNDNPLYGKVAAFIQSEIESTLDGVSVELQSVPMKTRIQMMGESNFELCLMRWGPDYADPMTILNLYDPSNSNPNYSHFDSEEFAQQLAECNTAEYANDLDKRWDLMKQMETEIIDSGASIPLYQVGKAALMRSYVDGDDYRTCGAPYIFKYFTINQ